MPAVDRQLHDRLQSKLGLSRRQVDRLITATANQRFLPRHQAAIALAASSGVNVSRIANPDDLNAIRQASSPSSPRQNPEPVAAAAANRSGPRPRKVVSRNPKRRGTSIFVVHGRNEVMRRSLFQFLRAVGLKPLEWRKAIQLTGKPSPYVGEILDAAFREAVAIVVLLSPDDEAKLRDQFVKPSDPDFEKNLTPQPRPNVLFEAGMAFGRNPESTVLVQVGSIRPFSDVAGRHVVNLSNSVESRQELVTKLANAGCNVDTSGTDWHTEGSFAS